jgi:hypothetical protein
MTLFDRCWGNLCTKLRPIAKMYGWSAAGKARSTFGINEVTPSGINVKTSKGLRFVPRTDFEMIFPWWPDYKNDKVQRQELRNICVNSTYVISIFLWLELQ